MNASRAQRPLAPIAVLLAATTLLPGCWRAVEPAELPKVGHVLSLKAPDGDDVTVSERPDVRIEHEGECTRFRAPVEVERTGEALTFRTADAPETTIALARIDAAAVRGRAPAPADPSLYGIESTPRRRPRAATVVLIVVPSVVVGAVLLADLSTIGPSQLGNP